MELSPEAEAVIKSAVEYVESTEPWPGPTRRLRDFGEEE